MPGGVIVVERRGKLGLAERLYLPMLVRALAVSARHFFRNLRGFVSGKNRRDFVVQYPEERVDYPDAFRGVPVLVAGEDGRSRCVACGSCELACPTDCIRVEAVGPGATAGERRPALFELDLARCMFCGLCEEACPEQTIVMSRSQEMAAFDRASLRLDESALLVPATLLERRLDFLRRRDERRELEGGQRAG